MGERYSHGHHESVLRSHRWRTVENSAAYLAPLLTPGTSLLDVGCGPGTITVEFAQRVAPGAVVGLDVAAEVIASATELGATVNGVEFIVGDVYELPFDDDSFDVVHAHQLLQHLADPVAALREMRRVTRPGGVVAARDVDYRGAVWYPELPGLARWMEIYQAVHRGNGGEPDAGRRLLHWARAAGFAEVEAGASVWSFSSPADRAWWGGMWADRTLHSALHDDALDSGAATAKELRDVASSWRSWAEHPEASFFIPHGEILAQA